MSDRTSEAGTEAGRADGSADRPTILVVDDDADLRHAIVTWLQNARGFTVLSARDGEEARQWAEVENLQIDLALVDIVLPDSFGSQVAFDQLVFRPDIKTIFMSGHVPDDEVLAATSRPGGHTPAEFLQKPFKLSDLGDAIDRVLGMANPGGGAEDGDGDGAGAEA